MASTRPYGSILIGGAALCVLVALSLYAAEATQSHERSTLNAALGDSFDAEESLSDARLQWFTAANRLDPIFAIEGTDPASLEDSVDYLGEQRDLFADLYSNPDADVLRGTLYPMDFLRLLSDLEQQRRALLAQPSTERALQYSAALVRTIGAYETDADRLARALQKLPLDSYRFVYVDGSTKTNILSTSLISLKERAGAQRQKALLRLACLMSFTSDCPPLSVLSASGMSNLHAHAPSAPAPQDVREIAEIAQRVVEGDGGYVKSFSHLIAIPSACQPYDPAYFLAWWRTSIDSPRPFLKSEMVNDIYIHDLTEESHLWEKYSLEELEQRGVALLYNKALSDQGGRFYFQPSGNSYFCPDAGLDDAALRRVVSLVERLEHAPLFRDLETNELSVSHLAAEEEDLLSSSTLDIALTDAFIRDAQAFLQESGANAVLGPERIAYARDIVAEYLQGSAHSDELLRSVANENLTIEAYIRVAGQHIPASSLLISRSAASILFFAGNPTFVPGTPVSFFDQSGAYRGPLLQMHTLRSLRTDGYSTETLVSGMQRSADIKATFFPPVQEKIAR